MGKDYKEIDSTIRDWISRQRVFFVATAPLAADGMLNCSPKGMDTFRVIDSLTVAYLDLTGSGVETIAHVKENKRIVIMMCAFENQPKIFRFHGEGEVCEHGEAGYRNLIQHFTEHSGARAIVKMKINRISDSCGYSVPRYKYQEERETLVKWAQGKGEDELIQYRAQKNRVSVEGLPGYSGGGENV